MDITPEHKQSKLEVVNLGTKFNLFDPKRTKISPSPTFNDTNNYLSALT